jgi:hypothetical protein
MFYGFLPSGYDGLLTAEERQAKADRIAASAEAANAKKAAEQAKIDALVQQILGQNTTSKWSGEGFGSAQANAADMAKILSGIGITDINQFGEIKKETIPGEPIYGGAGDDPQIMGYSPERTVSVYGNKLTGQAVPNTYSERQTGNAWGGTFAGSGNTGYRVQFGPDGTPYFYTTGASSNDIANLLADNPLLNVVANIAAATFGGPLGTAALQAAQGKDLGDIAKAAALSYLGGEVGNSVTKGLTDTLGSTAANIAGNVAKTEVATGGKADPVQALISGGIGAGTSAVLGNIEGFDSLDQNTQKAITKVVSSTIANGGNLSPGALINAAVTAGKSMMANATNTPTEEQNQVGVDKLLEELAPYREAVTAPTEAQQQPAIDQLLEELAPYREAVTAPTEEQQQPAIDQLLEELAPYREAVTAPTEEQQSAIDQLLNEGPGSTGPSFLHGTASEAQSGGGEFDSGPANTALQDLLTKPQAEMSLEDWAKLYATPTTDPDTGETIVGGNVEDFPVQDFGDSVGDISVDTDYYNNPVDLTDGQTINFDDGSSITIDAGGNITDVTQAPAGSLIEDYVPEDDVPEMVITGKRPEAEKPQETEPDEIEIPEGFLDFKLPDIQPGAGVPNTPAKPTTPAAPANPTTPTNPANPTTPTNPKPTDTSGGNLAALLALLAGGGGQPQQQAVQPNAADIKSFEELGYGDLFGSQLFTSAPASSAQTTKQYSTGGQIDDLLRLLRS